LLELHADADFHLRDVPIFDRPDFYYDRHRQKG
jgi:hypothetical protein